METKKWYASKTVWFNVLFVVVALAGQFGFGDFAPNPDVAAGVALLGPVINFVLRLWFTNKGIG